MTLPRIAREALSDNPFVLAGQANVASPDGPTSPGATFLLSVRSSVLDALDYVDLDDFLRDHEDTMSESVHEIADGCVPVYTHDLWATFVDLAAYNVDVSDVHGDIPGDQLERVPGVALYSVAQTLAEALINEAHGELDAAVDSATDAASNRGTLDGTEAAQWWAQEHIGGRVTGGTADVARAVLDGIENGDPVTMDSLPSADGMTVSDLLGADLSDLDGTDTAALIGDAYRDSFNEAAQHEVERLCQDALDDRY